MGLDWNFVRITPEQHTRLFSDQTFETLEAIHDERITEGSGYLHSPNDDGHEIPSFDTVYHLGIRTDHDELDTLMTFEDDDGPIVTWPLGDSGVKLSSLGELAYLLNPEEVRSIAPTLQQLLDKHLHLRYRNIIEELGGEASELEEIFPKLQECFRDLTNLIQTSARHGDAIFWDLS